MSGGEFSAYDTIPSNATEISVGRLLAALQEPRRQHRIIFAGFKKVPLTYWFMQRVKSYLLHMNVKVDEASKNVIDFCLSTTIYSRSVPVVVNSYAKPIPQYDDYGEPIMIEVKRGRKTEQIQKTKDEYHVGSSWLSKAIYLVYNYLVTNHGCKAPIYAFVKSLDPMNEVREGVRDAPRDIQYLEQHREHLKIQERFLYLIAQYQAAKQERGKDQYQNRSNPQRLMDIEMEKMHIGLFRSSAVELGTIYWNKPYMSRSTNFSGLARGAIGMVGSHGCPTAKELEAYKEKMRTTGKRFKRTNFEVDDQELRQSFTDGAGAPVPKKRKQRPAATPATPTGPQPRMSARMQRNIANKIAASPQLEGMSDYEVLRLQNIANINAEIEKLGLLPQKLQDPEDQDDPESLISNDEDEDEESTGPPTGLRRSSRNRRPASQNEPKISVGMVGAL